MIRELGLVKQKGDRLVLDEEALKNIKKMKQKNLKAELAHKLLDDAIQSALTGNKTPSTALKNAQKSADKLLKRYR